MHIISAFYLKDHNSVLSLVIIYYNRLHSGSV